MSKINSSVTRPACRLRHSREHGQSLVEFAMVVPVLAVTLLAILSFGMLIGWKHLLSNAARDGARFGAVCKTDAQIEDVVATRISMLPNSDSVSVSVSVVGADGSSLASGQRQKGGAITVTLSYPANVVGISGLFGGTQTLSSQATFCMECDSGVSP